MQVKSAGGKEYEYIAMDDYTRAVYTGPLRLKSEAPEAFKVFKAVAENESQKYPDGQRARVVHGEDEGYLRVGRH